MALRPRLQMQPNSTSAKAAPTRDVGPSASTTLAPAKPRDAAFQDRLKTVATAQAAKKAAASAAEADDCKRRARRKATALPGLITFKTMRLQVPCTIADMSGTGARLVLPVSTAATFGDLEHLPQHLVLVMRSDRMQVDCEIKWRRVGSLGVRFLGAPVPLERSSR